MYAYPPSHACAAESENPKLICICSFVAHRYRTPQAFRAFTRVYLLLAGALYGPYFVELGLGHTGTERNLWFALLFACCTQLIFCGLYRSMLSLEDLFARRNSSMYAKVDVIKVPEMVELVRQQLLEIESKSLQESTH